MKIKVKYTEKNVSVTFNISGLGNELIKRVNEVNALAKKHNAQKNIFENKSPFRTTYNPKTVQEITTARIGDYGGTITFHDHSCKPYEAYQELIELLEPYAEGIEYWEEVRKTHRENGEPYKCPQMFTVRCEKK